MMLVYTIAHLEIESILLLYRFKFDSNNLIEHSRINVSAYLSVQMAVTAHFTRGKIFLGVKFSCLECFEYAENLIVLLSQQFI